MIETTDQGLMVYRDPHLADPGGLVHGHFTRRGGVSTGKFSSLNVSEDVGDETEAVRENRRRIVDALGGGPLVMLRQVHGSEVLVWSRAKAPRTPLAADAVVTDEKGVLVSIQTADCQAVMLHDPIRQVVANVHAGWRGSVAGIIGNTIRTMTRSYRCRPEDIRAGVGPSLGPCCAEFVNYQNEIPESLWSYKDERHHFDFWRISEDQLLAQGLKQEHIGVSRLCTRCNKDLFFSYRRDKVTGRLANVIGLLRK